MGKIIAIVNIVVASFFLTDTYLVAPIVVEETFSEIISEISRSRRGSYTNDFIVSSKGNKYEVPKSSSIVMNVGDAFFVNKSRLCRRPLQVIVPKDEKYYKVDVGLINEKVIVKIMVCFIVVISMLSLTKIPIFKNAAHKEELVFAGGFLSLVIIFFYFYQ